MNLAAGLKTLDPAFASDKRSIWMTAQLFNGLVELDSSLQVRPSLASRWEISESGKVYRFFLRNDVFFQPDPAFSDSIYRLPELKAWQQALSGQLSPFGGGYSRKVRAQDFVYSFHRICDPQVASSGAWIFGGKIKGLQAFREGQAPRIEGFQALNDSCLQIELTEPFPPFLGLLAMPYCYVVPWEAVQYYGERFRANPVGTGPFRMFRWEEGHHLILHRNPVYFERENGQALPYLKAVSVRFMPSRLSAFVAFLQGKLDFINGIDDAYKDELLSPGGEIRPRYAQKYKFQLAPQLNVEYLGMLVEPGLEITQDHPLMDPRVRQALNHAIDRQKLVRYLLNGMGYPATSGFIPRGMPGFDPEAVPGYKYDLTKARALLAKAGYPNGEGLPPITLYSTPLYANISAFVQKAFENIGVRLEVQNMQGGTLRSEVRSSRLNFWRASWIADYPDGENYLSLFYSPFDSLYRAARIYTEDSLRHRLYQEMDRLILEEAPVIPLYYDRVIRILQPGIRGLSGNPMNHLQLKRVRKE
jgi:oligopeptide transport system substrate-binding protein